MQPLSGLNSIDFVQRVFRKRRDVEILSRRAALRGVVSKAEMFHRFPGVEQSHVVIVKDIAVLIPRILFLGCWFKLSLDV